LQFNVHSGAQPEHGGGKQVCTHAALTVDREMRCSVFHCAAGSACAEHHTIDARPSPINAIANSFISPSPLLAVERFSARAASPCQTR
jgi:hypothetical protein